jgi:hypothetical protein
LPRAYNGTQLLTDLNTDDDPGAKKAFLRPARGRTSCPLCNRQWPSDSCRGRKISGRHRLIMKFITIVGCTFARPWPPVLLDVTGTAPIASVPVDVTPLLVGAVVRPNAKPVCATAAGARGRSTCPADALACGARAGLCSRIGFYGRRAKRDKWALDPPNPVEAPGRGSGGIWRAFPAISAAGRNLRCPDVAAELSSGSRNRVGLP